MQKHPIVALAALSLSPLAGAQTLMIPDSTADTVMLFSAVDGSLINPVFIDLTTATPAPATPIEAIEVGNEIWISDQLADTVFRYTSDGTTFLGTATVGRDNMRGIELIHGSVYVTNSGTGGAGYGDVCKEYATDGTLLNTFPVGDPFDVIDNGGELLIANIADESLDRYAYDGTFIAKLHDSDGVTGIDFPEQLVRRANGNILAAGFSPPAGVYEYDQAGTQLNYWDTSTLAGLRGVAELDNGMLLITSGGGVYTLDPGTGATTLIHASSARFITRMGGNAGPGTAYCLGDGTGTLCPCGNDNDGSNGPAGCANGVNAGGASLSAGGTSSLSANDAVLNVSGSAPSQPGLFFRADNAVNGGLGNLFGDGLRCAGGTVIRLQIVPADASGNASSSAPLGAGLLPGDIKRYQYWYRNPGSSLCGSAFNLTNGYEIAWQS
ncbi:MAG: hypothetical protein H6828_06930 [Planctomycetes bacterium]|nr:hypothetical protein [Planctomycetota bacterium]